MQLCPVEQRAGKPVNQEDVASMAADDFTPNFPLKLMSKDIA
jgi:3-hydroxyisobutyrate dehydrogenase-like beta-hydroxyacid dehydrogenase